MDVVLKDAIVPRLTATKRDEAVVELVDALIRAGAADASLREKLVKSVLDREKRGSTGFGKGVAVPHVKQDNVKHISAAVGLSAGGIDFNSLDKQPVYSVFLLLSPADNPEEHLQAMEIIFKHLSQDTFRRFLRQASTVEQVVTLLEDADNQQLGA
jgi:mannitol/fructose-specific phosphotransferase system IIA component (Ntr-type)